MSLNHTNWQAESRDRDIDVTAPLPYAGSVLPLTTNIDGVMTHLDDVDQLPYGALMGGGTVMSEGFHRRLISWRTRR